MKVEEFEHEGFHVELWWNGVYGKFFWVTGHSERRFSGACEYFATVSECRENAKRNLTLLAREKK